MRKPSHRAIDRARCGALVGAVLVLGLFDGPPSTTCWPGRVPPAASVDSSQVRRPGWRGLVYQVARPAFDSRRRAPLVISSYAGRRSPAAVPTRPGLLTGVARRLDGDGPAAASLPAPARVDYEGPGFP